MLQTHANTTQLHNKTMHTLVFSFLFDTNLHLLNSQYIPHIVFLLQCYFYMIQKTNKIAGTFSKVRERESGIICLELTKMYSSL